MPAYDATQFEPPAPLARVTLRNLDTGTVWSDVPMLLDSGADITLIPQAAVNLLGVTVVPDRRYELIGFDGNTSFAPVVRLELVFCGRIAYGPKHRPLRVARSDSSVKFIHPIATSTTSLCP